MKILVRGTNWIGDAVMTIPALKALRLAFPSAEIHLQSAPGAADIFIEADYLDNVFAPKDKRGSLRSVMHQSSIIRPQRFDIGILFANSFESALVHRIGRVNRRFGFVNEGRRFLLTDPVEKPRWKSERHEVYYYLELVSEVARSLLGPNKGVQEIPELAIPVSIERKKNARISLDAVGVDVSKTTVALGIGSTNSRAKRWPANNYAKLADNIINELGAQVILVGSVGDRPIAEEVMNAAKSKVVDLTGRTSVGDAIAILSESGLLISNDMGLAHAAPAVGTPTIVIFGPTNDLTTRPFSGHVDIINKNVECSPCMLRDCPIDHRCMEWISVDEVFSRTKSILKTAY